MSDVRRKRKLLKKILWVLTVFQSAQAQMMNLILHKRNRGAYFALMLNEEPREKIARIENFYETVIPRYTIDDFRSHFRLSRYASEILLNTLGRTR